MKYRVTKDGFYVTNDFVPVGTEFSIDGELPGGWAHFVEPVGKGAAKAPVDAELIVNPAQDADDSDIKADTPRRGRPKKDA